MLPNYHPEILCQFIILLNSACEAFPCKTLACVTFKNCNTRKVSNLPFFMQVGLLQI